MSTLYVTEFRALAGPAMPWTPPVREQQIPIETLANSSEPWDSETQLIMICGDEDFCLAFGKDPEAEPDVHWVPAGQQRFYAVKAGEKLSCVMAGG